MACCMRECVNESLIQSDRSSLSPLRNQNRCFHSWLTATVCVSGAPLWSVAESVFCVIVGRIVELNGKENVELLSVMQL